MALLAARGGQVCYRQYDSHKILIMPKIKLLHIIDSLDIGGTEKRCLEILSGKELLAGFDAHLIYFRSGALVTELNSLGIAHHHVPIGSFASAAFWQGIAAIVRFMREQRITVLQTYGFYSNVPGIIAAKLAGVPIILAGRRDQGEFLRPSQRRIEQWLWRFADRIVTNAVAIKEGLIQAGVPAAKVVVIKNGIQCGTIPEPLEKGSMQTSVVGMVANFRHQKDHLTFLKAALVIAAKRPEVRFFLVGSGPCEQSVRESSEARELGERIRFCGNLLGNALEKFVQSLTISVLCSHGNEGLPNVVLEAMEAGKPVVATDVGGTRDAVKDGITGFLIPPRCPDVLAEKVLWLLDHPETARKMGSLGRQEVENNFGLDRMRRAFRDLYLEVLDQKGVQARA
jgi:glycosyltransferase involved in cell wall biosynthesis